MHITTAWWIRHNYLNYVFPLYSMLDLSGFNFQIKRLRAPCETGKVVVGIWLLSRDRQQPEALNEGDGEDEELGLGQPLAEAGPPAVAKGHKVLGLAKLPVLDKTLRPELFGAVPEVRGCQEVHEVLCHQCACRYPVTSWRLDLYYFSCSARRAGDLRLFKNFLYSKNLILAYVIKGYWLGVSILLDLAQK